METFRLNSKLCEKDREYLIQTSNDAELGSVSTTVYVDGMRTDTHCCPYPEDLSQEQLLEMVKTTHSERKKELEGLLQAYQRAGADSDVGRMFQLSMALYHKRLYYEALDLLKGIVGLRSGYHRAHDLLGRTYLASGQAGLAVEAGTQAVALRPQFPDYRCHLGEAYLSVGSADLAIAEFEAAVDINMYYSEAYFNLGLAHILAASRPVDRSQVQPSVIRAQEHLAKASLVYSDYLSHRNYSEGLAALESHDFGRALSLLRSVGEARKELQRQKFVAVNGRLLAHPDSWTVHSIGEQIESLRAELEKHPGYFDLQTKLMHCYLEQAGMIWDQGLEVCQRIMEAQPNHERASSILEDALHIRVLMLQAIKKISKEG